MKPDQVLKDIKRDQDVLEAGTGFMVSLADTLRKIQSKGYGENLTSKVDHFEARSGEIKLYPVDFKVDEIVRFENTSDPDDQAILYAVSSEKKGVKGIFVESFGVYNEELSPEMTECLKAHPH